MSEEVMNESQKFVYVRTYSRWIDSENRRETWEETADRYVNYIMGSLGDKVPQKVYKKIRKYLLSLDVMPSMRLLWSAGDSHARCNTVGYNCSFLALESPEDFAEMLYLLMSSVGVGYSVAREFVNNFPTIPVIGSTSEPYTITDSKEGWADSLKVLMYALLSGHDVAMDYGQIRPKGSRLKTSGGRASGPEPLIVLHQYIREVFQFAQGRKLTSIELSDIACQIAEIVVVGGTRRAALISLSDLEDELMRDAKIAPFPVRRFMVNNSAIYEEKPTAVKFLQEWAALAASGSGERGFFNLGAARKNAPKRRKSNEIEGLNPCSEILLRKRSFCNLSEVVIKENEDFDSLLDKVETATWLGVIQSSFTNFRYLRPIWKENCDEERLLGVSLTGQYDSPNLVTPEKLAILKEKVLKTAKRASHALGINMPAATTCVKPSGTVSQLVNSSSGMHPRYSDYYIRRYRIAAVDPLCKLMIAQNIPMSPENGQRKSDWAKAVKKLQSSGSLSEAHKICNIFKEHEEWSESKVNTWIVSFPQKAPDGAITVAKVSAIDQLEWYKKLQDNWCEHNASVTVYVKDDEWMTVGQWVYENWDKFSGISFLPADSGTYEQAPYEKITKDEYNRLVASRVEIDYNLLNLYETEDSTEGAKTLACVSGSCEL